MKGSLSLSFLFFVLVAEIIGTIGDFGSSVFFVPIANFYFDFETLLGLTAMFHLACIKKESHSDDSLIQYNQYCL
jgi:hypothetical protein